MINITTLKLKLTVALFGILISLSQSYAQPRDWELDKWPADLETEFALSALPSHLRADATVYLLEPAKRYYTARQGTNGFTCFVSRTEWEWADFRRDHAAPISYDAEGSRTILKVFFDVATMRATGKYSALQVRDSVVQRVK